MLKPDDMPTPWRHPKYGTYYLKKRVPQDIKHLWTKADPYQISLGTKDESKAHTDICKAWLALQGEFDDLRKKVARQVGLCEEIIPDLLDEWLYDNLKQDEVWRFEGVIARTDENSWYGYPDLIDQLAEASYLGRHPQFLTMSAEAFLSHKGINYDRASFVYAKFLDELSSKYAHYLSALAARDEGRRVQTPAPPKVKDLMSLDTLYDKFKAQRTGEKMWKDPETQDKREYGPIVREFIAVVGSKPVHQLTQDDAQKYYEHTLARSDIALGTKKRNLTRIKTLLLYGKNKHKVPDITGPLEITTSYKKTHKSYERFAASDLEALFHSDDYKTNTFKKSSQYWLPMLGLYTGARIDEIASLQLSEITELEGVWCYYMSSKEANGGGKNDFAPRWVPIHPKVLEAGFLTFWQTVKDEGHLRLFPEMGNAARDGYSKRATADFTEYRRSVSVGALTERSTKAFHSFRSTLVSELKQRGIDGDMRRELVGHSKGKGDVHDTVYDQAEFNPGKALAALSRADFGLQHPEFVDSDSMKKARQRHRKKSG